MKGSVAEIQGYFLFWEPGGPWTAKPPHRLDAVVSGGDEQIAIHGLNHSRDFYTIPVKFRGKILVPQRIRPIIDKDDAGIII